MADPCRRRGVSAKRALPTPHVVPPTAQGRGKRESAVATIISERTKKIRSTTLSPVADGRRDKHQAPKQGRPQSHCDAQTRIGAADTSSSRCKSLSRSEERSRAIQLEAVRHHDDRLGTPLAFVHRKVDRLSLVGEQPATPALCVSDDPAPKMVLPDVEAQTNRGHRFDALLLNHWFFPHLGVEARCPVAGSEPSSPS